MSDKLDAQIKKMEQQLLKTVKEFQYSGGGIDAAEAAIIRSVRSKLEILKKKAKEHKAKRASGQAAGGKAIQIEVGGVPYEFDTEAEKQKFLKTVHVVTIEGKQRVFVGKEYETFQNAMTQVLQAKVVFEAKRRASAAAAIWKRLQEMQKDQAIVSRIVNLGNLPDCSAVVSNGQKAAQALELAVKSKDFKKIKLAMEKSAAPINKAYDTVAKLSEKVTSRAGTAVTVLEFTKTTSFKIVESFLGAQLGGTAGSNAIAGGFTSLVSSCSNEFGKFLADTYDGPEKALENIVRDTAIGAATGGLLKTAKGKEIVEGAGKAVAKAITGKWLSQLGRPLLQKVVETYLMNAGKSIVEGALGEAGNIVKGKTKSVEEAIKNIATNAALGGVLKGFDDVIDDRLASSVFEKLPAKFTEGTTAKALKGIMGSSAKEPTKKSLQLAFGSMRGSEKPEAVVDKAAEYLAKNAELLKQLEAQASSKPR